MSTKIYSGFVLTIDSWPEIHRHVQEFREELAGVALSERTHEWACLASHFLDSRAIGMSENALAPYWAAWEEMRKSDEHREFRIAFFPFTDGKVYGMTFGPDSMEKRWFARDIVHRFGYWNNTDRPRDVGAREWERRAKLWDKILVNGTPAMSGFVATCLDRPGMIDPGEIAAAQPSLRVRAKALAVEKLTLAGMGDHEQLTSFLAARNELMTTEEGRAKVAREAEGIIPMLAPTITRGLLLEAAS